MGKVPKTMNVDDIIRDVTAKSDIAFGSGVYQEIARELIDIGLNLALFVFATREHSSCARALDGKTETCPVLTVYLKYDADFVETGIDPHSGNWDDRWKRTQIVRDTLNLILRRHGFDNDYVSDHTFIFVRTLEELAFREIGRECKDAIKKLVCEEAPGVSVSYVFWNGYQFAVIMEDKSDYKRVKRKVKTKATNAIPKILAAADKDGCCQNYKASIGFGYTGMDLVRLIRNDL